MKKIFAFLFASALLATALISCGGGGDDDQYRITTQKFRNGVGFGFMMNPNLEVCAGSLGQFAPQIGGNGTFDIVLPGDTTGGAEGDNTQTGVTTTYQPVGNEIICQTRRVRAGNEHYTAKVMFREAYEVTSSTGSTDNFWDSEKPDIDSGEVKAIVTISFDDIAATSSESLAGGLGMLLRGSGNDILDDPSRSYITSLAGCLLQIVLDSKSQTAQIVVSATGVNYVDQEGNEFSGINLGPYSISSPVPYYPVR